MSGILVVLAVFVAILVLRHAGRLPPEKQRAFSRMAGGVALGVIALGLLVKGQQVIGLPLLAISAGLLGWSRVGPKPKSGRLDMVVSKSEAYEILGLQPTASAEEIRSAHKRLLRAIHPDVGGSTHLAAQINAARDALLNS